MYVCMYAAIYVYMYLSLCVCVPIVGNKFTIQLMLCYPSRRAAFLNYCIFSSNEY